MSARHLPVLVFCALILWLLGDLVLAWPMLPQRIATHFNAAGYPNRWSSPTALLSQIGAQLGFMVALFVAAGWVGRLPDQLVNLPNKDYWLAPERRAATFDALRDWMRWFLIFVLAMLAFVETTSLHANLTPNPRLDLDPWLLIAGSLAPALAMLGWLYWRFRVPAAPTR
jgi:serine/threonine-protein kinase